MGIEAFAKRLGYPDPRVGNIAFGVATALVLGPHIPQETTLVTVLGSMQPREKSLLGRALIMAAIPATLTFVNFLHNDTWNPGITSAYLEGMGARFFVDMAAKKLADSGITSPVHRLFSSRRNLV